jgi:hypothetical protein
MKSSITDQPIHVHGEDKLKSNRYADALAQFIQTADTPLTIGLQGEWGTGKTSMMYLLQEKMQALKIATSWVNTWEYSMFRGAHETTPAVLKGMLDRLKESCKAHGTWTESDERNQKVAKIGRFIGRLANQVIAAQTGIDVQAAKDSSEETIFVEIAAVKAMIREVIDDLIKDTNNPYERVVFFVDDLDRIPPSDAVEVLEALKNIFDVPNCVYVLAIDYDVVVKGLESKFGPKTDENEREFRSFFDKIIQVPFSMPTGSYDIQTLLVDKLKDVGFEIPEDQKKLFTDVVRYTVGFNPRSLKRFMNSFSLLRKLRSVSEEDVEPTEYDDLVLFALLGLQISYNSVFRIIAQDPQFWEWTAKNANKLKINLDQVAEQAKQFGDEMKSKTDEVWEQVLYGFCTKPLRSGQPDPYLSARWEAIIDLLNLLATAILGGPFNKKQNNLDEFVLAWTNGLSLAAITNVDDDQGLRGKDSSKRKHVRFDDLPSKLASFKEEGVPDAQISLWSKVHDALVGIPALSCKYNGSAAPFRLNGKEFVVLWNPNPKKKEISFYLTLPNGASRPPVHLVLEFNPPKDDKMKVVLSNDSDFAAFNEFLKNLKF